MARRCATSRHAVLRLVAIVALAVTGCTDEAAPRPPKPRETPVVGEPTNVTPLLPRPTPRAGELRPRGGLVIAHDAIRPRVAVGASGAIVAWARRDCAQSEHALALPWAALEAEPPASTGDACAPSSVSLVLGARDAAAIVCSGPRTCEVRGLGDVSRIEPVPRDPEPDGSPIAIDDQGRLVRRYRAGVDVPIAGIGVPVTAMASTTGERGPLVLWVEREPPAHRVRVGWLSMPWTDVVAAADLDVGDAVVGDVAIDAREGHVAIALTQREADGWVVRTAELTPP